MKVILLDRDGVINEDSDDYIKSPDEWIPIPGSLEAISRLNRAGYRVFIVTNQSGVGRGLFDIETLHAIHQKLLNELQKLGGRLDAILFCPHTPDDQCDCRKPNAGLYEEIERRLHQSLQGTYAIGDSFRDLQAAKKVDASPILVLTGKGQKTFSQHKDELSGIPCYENLSEAVDALLENAVTET
jgi:D-glycero-D-manno-heptose 1,7-bisphosphate phosphatase